MSHRQRPCRFPFALLARCKARGDDPVAFPAAFHVREGALMLFTPDDDFYDDPDLWDLPDCAVALVTRGGSWSARNHRGGFVPESMIARFTSDPVQAVRALASRKAARRVKGGIQLARWERWLQAKGRPDAVPEAARPDSVPGGEAGAEAIERRRAADRDRQQKKRERERAASGQPARKPGRPAKPQVRNVSRDSINPSRDQITDLDRSDLDLSQSVAAVSPSKSRSARAKTASRDIGPVPGAPEFRLQVQAEMALRVPGEISDARADAITAEVLGSAKGHVRHKLAYVLKAIRDEADPRGRWLPRREPQPRQRKRYPWCGKCEKTDRATYDEAGRLRPCPDCSGHVPEWLEAS